MAENLLCFQIVSLKKVPSSAFYDVTVLSKIHRGNMAEGRQPVRQSQTMRVDSQRKLLAEIIFDFS
ncbi:MAG: hypothetical protein E5V92_26775 [Mesorhizobium sp.]|nr:MAG: hypothetical protein EOS61_22820 [Mesorhizobium sp.]TIV98765.1 MAG: hypothetical protein E5V85_10130 [Mesorhizobium sp.]TJW78201.1 MAG: hypothetical protein E5V92_26775 [Mesorhizobium sp.]